MAAAEGLLPVTTFVVAVMWLGLIPVTAEGAGDVAAGRAFVEEKCASCHAIGPSGASPLERAPPFRTLHERYPVESLAEGLAEGIVTGHPEMPQFVLEPEEIDAVIAYLKSLEE
jgi:cytochrome c